jgi:putative sterol carrier protein
MNASDILVGLKADLDSFRAEANACAQLAPILKGWNPVFHLESRDDGAVFSLTVRDGKVQELTEGRLQAERPISLVADTATLRKLFTGGLNPVEAHSNGDLEVYGDVKDQVKLDAVVLVLWDI